MLHIVVLFFFQAEDGIRVTSVTGVQTCALLAVAEIGAEGDVGDDGMILHLVCPTKHVNHEATKSRRSTSSRETASCLRDFVVNNPLDALSFASVAAGFAFFAADLPAAPWLGHAVSFPFGCTENIHRSPKRLANAHSHRKAVLSG